MTTRTWSSDQLKQDFPKCHILKDIISSVEENLLEAGQVVCDIRVNGESLSEDDEDEMGQKSVSSIGELEVTSRYPKDLVVEAINSYIELLPQVKEKCVEVAERFRNNELPDAQQDFTNLLDSCRWFTDALHLLKSNVHTWIDPELNLENWSRAEQTYSSVVKEMLQAFEQPDYVLLADLLEYELSNCLDDWLNVLHEVSGFVAEAG